MWVESTEGKGSTFFFTARFKVCCATRLQCGACFRRLACVRCRRSNRSSAPAPPLPTRRARRQLAPMVCLLALHICSLTWVLMLMQTTPVTTLPTRRRRPAAPRCRCCARCVARAPTPRWPQLMARLRSNRLWVWACLRGQSRPRRSSWRRPRWRFARSAAGRTADRAVLAIRPRCRCGLCTRPPARCRVRRALLPLRQPLLHPQVRPRARCLGQMFHSTYPPLQLRVPRLGVSWVRSLCAFVVHT